MKTRLSHLIQDFWTVTMNPPGTRLVRYLLFASVFLSGCDAMNPLSGISGYIQPAKGTATAAPVAVYYATNRAPARDNAHDPWFGSDFAAVSYGTASVTVPAGHIVGGAQLPPFLGNNVTRTDTSMSEHPRPLGKAEFFSRIKTAAEDKGNNILLIVHGFNTLFPEAVCAAGQLDFDLSSKAVPVVFSWPSRGTAQYPYMGTYPIDENSEYDSIDALRDFLNDMHSHLAGAHIHLIAHSMGCRLVVDALRRTPAPTDKWFTNLVFAAPDVDANGFAASLASGTTLPTFAENLSVYVCEHDLALLASRELHGKTSRAGEGGKYLQPITNPAIQTIDATQVVKSPPYHAYVFDNRDVIQDLYVSIVLGKVKASDRVFLAPTSDKPNVYTLLP
ncbi:MAG: alpha/beta fold hydrolase [Phycisphaerales bacterium]|nr:alpha/beta fold hydrolase [Phycisphaerales bacterium]MDB5356596.1 alpha/beta fold hydrolase [Phycisphaerales bacterium]